MPASTATPPWISTGSEPSRSSCAPAARAPSGRRDPQCPPLHLSLGLMEGFQI